ESAMPLSEKPAGLVGRSGGSGPSGPSNLNYQPSTCSSRALTRRRLLGGAAGALAAPLVVPARALGLGGHTAPSNRIVLAHIGVGGQGMQHVVGGIWTQAGGMTGRDDVQVVAVCDVNAQRVENARNQVNQRYGNSDCRTYRDFRELLGRS